MLAAIGLLHAAHAAADAIQARAAEHDDFGRVVFDWPSRVGYTTEAQGRQIVIRFERPVEVNLASAARALTKYVGAAKVGEDGRSVVLSLKGDFGLRHFVQGNSVVVDVLASSPSTTAGAAASPSSAPAAPAPGVGSPPASAPLIPVRTGEHDDYTRIVFDWPTRVAYRVERSGGSVSLRFERTARVDVERLRARPPKFVANVSSQAADGATTVALTIPETSEIKHFLSDSKVVLDIRAPVPGAAPAAPASSGSAASPATAAAPSPAPAVRLPAALAADAAVANAAPQVAERPSSPADVAGQEQSEAPPAAPDSTSSEVSAPTAAARPTSLVAAAGSTPSPTQAPAPVSAGRQGPRPDLLAREVTATPGQGGAVALNFEWKEPVGAAVFRRAGALWVIFDKDVPVDLGKLRQAGGNVIRGIERVPVEGATALRIDTVAGINPELKRNGLSWILEFGRRGVQAPTAIEINAQTNSPVGARLFMPVPEPGNAIAVVDPAVRDTLVVVPVLPLGQGMAQLRDYPQFSLLPTAQGVVVKPKIDDIRVRPLSQGIELSSTSKLQITPMTADLAASASVGPLRPLTRMFDLEQDGREALEQMARSRQRLLIEVAKADPGEPRHKARLKLAHFFFGNGFHAEALGVLNTIAADRPDIAEDPEFLGLHGGAQLLMGRYREAHADFDKPILDDNDEAAFWRAALQASEGDLAKPAPAFRRLGSLIRPYPRALKMPLGMMVVDSFIAAGDVTQAQRFLDLIGAETATSTQKSQIAFLVGKLKALAGDYDGAVASWDQVRAGSHRPTRAKAIVGRAELLLRLGKVERKEIIDEYEQLRYVWRGDDFEFNLLRRLGRLYIEEGDYRNGLRTLRQAATNFRDLPEVPQVTQLMAETFANVYLGDAIDAMPPVAAIALYEEFKELTPAGARGDAVVRKLAEKLASIELFGRASELLENQVQFRLKGLERAQVGTRLAFIYYLDKKLPKALESLDKTEEASAPEDLRKARRLLRGRVLSEQDRAADVLALLKDDKSFEADVLRLELFWDKKDWVNAAQTLRKLMEYSKAEPDKPLDEKQSDYVLNLAIALTLSGNQRGINLLRRDFGTAMAKTENSDAFQLIASQDAQGLPDYRTIADKVQVADRFRGFITAYRKRLDKEAPQSVQ